MGANKSNIPPAGARRSPDPSTLRTLYEVSRNGVNNLKAACNESGHPRKTTINMDGQKLDHQYTVDELRNKKIELTALKDELDKKISSLETLLTGLDISFLNDRDVNLARNFLGTIKSTRFAVCKFSSSFDSAIARLNARLDEISPEGSP
jgi:hypothetical protein